ncbi:unnamed protein product [Chondrus crispus]|uniref:Uncharacterized protein n=1 Tax=Chondrus crispus TaxID=2769 RepID=R7QCE5_CHOCR|nr:unnamed protein product [Chondrus crispus]CDF35081.1 unnamed protein product [Chondrus crispus]|eukprot:XP_005714900.1 unnamed protein product [Chondrus crispus]
MISKVTLPSRLNPWPFRVPLSRSNGPLRDSSVSVGFPSVRSPFISCSCVLLCFRNHRNEPLQFFDLSVSALQNSGNCDCTYLNDFVRKQSCRGLQ